MSAGPRAAAGFLVVTALLFAVLLVLLGWRALNAGVASWVMAVAVITALVAVILGLFCAKGVGEGRL